MIDKITNRTNLLEKALDAAWLRNETISNNIANVNTPGFKKSNVRFEEFLGDAMDKLPMEGLTNEEGFIPIKANGNISDPVVETEQFTSMRRDSNNVDVDVEMAELAKNTIKFNTLVTQLSKQFSLIKSAINEGRK